MWLNVVFQISITNPPYITSDYFKPQKERLCAPLPHITEYLFDCAFSEYEFFKKAHVAAFKSGMLHIAESIQLAVICLE